jgi:hypothetical protein
MTGSAVTLEIGGQVVVKQTRTLIASVQVAAMTSKDPFSTWLSDKDGSYFQIAVVVSTAAIFVMWSIT